MKAAPIDARRYATDFALPDYGERLWEPSPSHLPWEAIVELFEAQRLAYMSDHDSPEERLANKVPERFIM